MTNVVGCLGSIELSAIGTFLSCREKVDEKIATELWNRISPDIKHGIHFVLRARRSQKKGQTKAEATAEALIELAETIYKEALNTGYDMGAKVFGDQ